MRWMKSTAPSAKPTTMPSVRSRKTVSRKVASSTTASPRELRSKRRELVLLGHVPGDDGEHAGERRERDVGGQRRGEQHEQQEEDRVQDAGDRPVRAGPHIGRGAGDGAGDADAAEQRRADIGRRPAPPVRSSSDGGGRSCRRPPPPTAAISMAPSSAKATASGSTACSFSSEKSGRCGAGNGAGMPPKRRADGLDRQGEEAGQRRRRRATAISMPGQCGGAAQPDDEADGQQRQRHGGRIDRVERSRQGSRSWASSAPGSLPSSVEPEQVAQLAREDDDGDAGGEADRDGIGDVLDVGAEPQEARQPSGSRPPSSSRARGRRCRGARRSRRPAR